MNKISIYLISDYHDSFCSENLVLKNTALDVHSLILFTHRNSVVIITIFSLVIFSSFILNPFINYNGTSISYECEATITVTDSYTQEPIESAKISEDGYATVLGTTDTIGSVTLYRDTRKVYMFIASKHGYATGDRDCDCSSGKGETTIYLISISDLQKKENLIDSYIKNKEFDKARKIFDDLKEYYPELKGPGFERLRELQNQLPEEPSTKLPIEMEKDRSHKRYKSPNLDEDFWDKYKNWNKDQFEQYLETLDIRTLEEKLSQDQVMQDKLLEKAIREVIRKKGSIDDFQ